MTATARVSEYLKSADLQRVNSYTVAAHLCMSDSTMRRRLVIEGTSLSALLLAERKRRTVELLNQPQISAWRLADACGYASGHNFYRAFKSWFGCCYLDYRRHAIPEE